MGGDEFVAVLARVADQPVARATVERIRTALSRPVPLPAGRCVQVG
jgi:GGDEF domain-containing protein